MKKEKRFGRSKFRAETLKSGLDGLAKMSEEYAATIDSEEEIILKMSSYYSVDTEDANWDFDDLDSFLSEYRNSDLGASITRTYSYYGKPSEIYFSFRLNFYGAESGTNINVDAPSREHIERLFHNFETVAEEVRIPLPPEKNIEPIVFIGHGRSQQWRDLKDHLQDQHGFQIEAYESGARAGHSIRDILDDMATKSSFALLVLTGEDLQGDEQIRARQNVVHETGLFQGRLGFARAIVLLENDVEEFSNIDGIQQIRFSKDNIRETFGDVLATLRREFG